MRPDAHDQLGEFKLEIRAAYDPETSKEFTKQDSDEVQHRLQQALNSFKFVK
jgi:hypothetical protein